MKQLNKFTMTLLSRSSNESFSRVAVTAFIAQLDPTLEEINDIKTAVSEAVTNCIVHAYKNEIGKIYISVRILECNVVEIKIRDKGCGIADVEKAMTPLYSSEGGERAGLGFTVMQSFMDSLRVSSREGKGTTVTMKKRISVRLNGNA
ncbi:MAG: anti-sigma F factor [Clostridia bacterium]|nr:anti-sigma F factor [Clostridia bacterium]MBR3593478.1 anti-sigma F factor [Clostridia bacterium]